MWLRTGESTGRTIRVVTYNVLSSTLEDLHQGITPEKRHFDYRKSRIVMPISGRHTQLPEFFRLPMSARNRPLRGPLPGSAGFLGLQVDIRAATSRLGRLPNCLQTPLVPAPFPHYRLRRSAASPVQPQLRPTQCWPIGTIRGGWSEVVYWSSAFVLESAVPGYKVGAGEVVFESRE